MIKKNIFFNFLGQSWSALLSLVFTPIYIKYLGIESYGLIGFFTILTSIFTIVDTGITPTIVREVAKYNAGIYKIAIIRDVLKTFEFYSFILVLLFFGGFALFSSFITQNWIHYNSLSPEVVTRAFSIMSIVTGLRFFEGFYKSIIIGLERQVLSNTIVIVTSTIRNFGALLLISKISKNIESFFIWQGIASVLTVILFYHKTYKLLPQSDRKSNISFTIIKNTWNFASGMIGVTFISLILTQSDKVLVSKKLTLESFGYYSIAISASAILFSLIVPISQAMYPRFCKLFESKNNSLLAHQFHLGSQLVSIISGSAFSVFFFFSNSILNIWLHNIKVIEQVEPVMKIILLGNLLNGLNHIPHQAQLSHGWSKLAFYINCFAVIFYLPSLNWALNNYGIIGVAWSWFFLNFFYFAISANLMFVRILKSEKLKWYFVDIIFPIAFSFISALIFKLMLPTPVGILEQLFSIFFCACICIIVSVLASKDILIILVKLLKSNSKLIAR
jgi:O-antigen/teichoic acid export membrane protein